MNMIKEFKTFILRGNIIDLAVAVIIGAAFSAIVGSFIVDVITPLLLKPAMDSLGVSQLEKLSWNGVLYGKFLAAVINFLVTAFIIFLLIKAVNKAKINKKEAPAPEIPLTKDQQLLSEIKDLLKDRPADSK
jgi:large conductance mechanosensitive channel